MTKITKYYIPIGISLLLGFLYYGWHAQWIIITIPTRIDKKQTQDTYSKKKVCIYYWHNNQWAQESTDLLWSTQETHNTKQLAQTVLSLLSEEYELKKKIMVTNVLSTYSSQQLLIFIDQSPFTKNMSIHTKHMIIESILKTLRENDIKTPLVNFFVGQQPLQDAHLDFSVSWPIQGFLGA